MLVLPIRRSDFDRGVGTEPFEGERFQFLRSLLISADKALQVGFDAESLGFRAGADFRFEVGMNSNIRWISKISCFQDDCTPKVDSFSSREGYSSSSITWVL
jgi:hypothetical protein